MIELRVLRYFLTVAREEGINKAAEVLHITQPTLSRQLAQLEDEIGVKLFRRGSKRIELTNEGIFLRRRAEEILSLMDKTEQELSAQEELVEGRIVIGCGELGAMQDLADILASFRDKYPLVTYDILTANADFVKEQMEKGLVDIGILLEPIDMVKFDFMRFPRKERWTVLMPADDPLTAKAAVEAGDLAGKTLILPRRKHVQSELLSWFGDAFATTNLLFTSNLSTNGALMVQKGLGYSLVIEGSVHLWDEKEIAHRPLQPQLEASSAFAWKRQQPLSLATEKFIEHARYFLGISRT